MALNSFTLKVRCFHISLLSSKPKISNEQTIGAHGWSQFSQKSCCSIPSILLRIQVNFSLSWQWRLWCLTLQRGEERAEMLQKGGQKGFEIMPSPSRMAWSFLYVPFPLCSLEWKVDFSSSFSLPRLHPALGSWQCQHSHPGITVKIASFFFDNKIQQPFGIPVAPQSPDPWLGPRGFVVGC